MNYKVDITSKAENDISKIYEYIFSVLKNGSAAYIFQLTIFSKIHSLETMPSRYPILEGSNSNIRKMQCLNYIVLFVIIESKVLILRVFHSSTNYMK